MQLRYPSADVGWNQDYWDNERIRRESDARRSAFITIVDLLTRKAGTPGRWLDVGCGSGVLMRAAEEKGWQVAGIDPSNSAVEIARARVPGAQVELGTIDTALARIRQPVDVVSLTDVLRHVPEPMAAIRGAVACLSKSGWIVIREIDARKRTFVRSSITAETSMKVTDYAQEFPPRSLAVAFSYLGCRDVRTLPSPSFTETGASAGRSAMSRPALGMYYRVATGANMLNRNWILTPNFLAVAQRG